MLTGGLLRAGRCPGLRHRDRAATSARDVQPASWFVL